MVEVDLVVASSTSVVAEVSFGVNSPIMPAVEGAIVYARTINDQSIISKLKMWLKLGPNRARYEVDLYMGLVGLNLVDA